MFLLDMITKQNILRKLLPTDVALEFPDDTDAVNSGQVLLQMTPPRQSFAADVTLEFSPAVNPGSKAAVHCVVVSVDR